MTEREIKLVIGGLLHDVGKVIYRTGNDTRKHSKSGADYITDEVGKYDTDIIECILYHHANSLKYAAIEKKSLAYITYIADNIASATDRRKFDDGDYGFDKSMPLRPVFNILNGNNADKYYHPMMLNNEINYPTDEQQIFDEKFYKEVKLKLTECLKGIEFNSQFVNSLLEVLEAVLCYVPSSTSKSEVSDISLFDHVKLTSAISTCIYKYLEEQNINNYKEELFDNEKQFYEKEALLLFSMDISGIQKFIYTIPSENALKSLRARSFYLEFMTEHIIDELLERVDATRANLIYSGGGHCYMLLPNTKNVKKNIDKYENELNEWMIEQFDIALYVAMGYCNASANTLKNIPKGSYCNLFKNVGNIISNKKTKRYSAKQIVNLNNKQEEGYLRECSVCKRRSKLKENGVCVICNNLMNISKDILYKDFFVVTKENNDKALPLPRDKYLIPYDEKTLKEELKEWGGNEKNSYIRIYSKNKQHTGNNIVTKIWVGNYTNGQSFKELADKSVGIKRIGIIRADVDNLGQTIVSGFDEKYNTLSRTATLSRHLSLFFKYYINDILRNGKYSVNGELVANRNATIVYSGGDDLFIVGAWNEIMEIAIDIRNALQKYTDNTLKISAGYGMYQSGYPINVIANEVGEYEEESKEMVNKNSITLLPDGCKHKESDSNKKFLDGTYSWEDFINRVLGEKYIAIKDFFDNSEERGKSVLYKLFELIRNSGDKLYFARYIYLLSRMEPGDKATSEQKELYRKFSKNMYLWYNNEKSKRELKTAINIYAYMNRNEEMEENQYGTR